MKRSKIFLFLTIALAACTLCAASADFGAVMLDELPVSERKRLTDALDAAYNHMISTWDTFVYEVSLELGYTGTGIMEIGKARIYIVDAEMPAFLTQAQRPLQSVYAMMILDAVHYSVRENGIVTKKAAYVAIGTDLEGRKDVLGIWLGATESAKYWLSAPGERHLFSTPKASSPKAKSSS